MKKAVKIMIILSIVIVMSVFAGTAAFASYYDTQADTLNELGLFQGTNNGYELDQTSTRAQAAVMLVRMLGKEAEVTTGSYTDPFTDVPVWAENYIGYMYENGLTNGTSATTFGSDENCSAQMFTAFVLRALGYSEGSGDFSYSEAQDFAADIGLVYTASSSDTFLRDDMVALSYTALFENIKDSDTTLLEELVSENAVEAATAEKYLAYFDTYQDYLAESAKADQIESMRMSATNDIVISKDGLTQSVSQTMDTSIVLKGNDFIMKQSVETDDGSTVTEMTSYYSDGWLYVETAGVKYKYEYPVDIAALIEQTGTSPEAEPFNFIRSIEKTETAAGVSYTMEYSVNAMNKMLSSILSQVSALPADADINYKSLEITAEFDANGNLTKITTSGNISVSMTILGQETSMDMAIVSVSDILETGDSVTVTLPDDLDDYEEMDLSQS